ncbi:MAG: hypothetical protein JXJ04_11005 [Spirochaetales bacterium]|nr:hypothetical protein [Spirochaetales bacterium]
MVIKPFSSLGVGAGYAITPNIPLALSIAYLIIFTDNDLFAAAGVRPSLYIIDVDGKIIRAPFEIPDIAIDFTENRIYFANNTINIYWKDMSESGTSPGGMDTLYNPAKNLIIDMSIDQIIDFTVDKKDQYVVF